jgi:hypothetical protein
MTDAQLHLAVGIPTIALLALETSMNTRFDLIMGRLADLDTRLSVLEDRSKRP